MSHFRHRRSVRGRRAAAMIAVLGALSLSATVSAGPWTQSLGKAYVKLDQGFFLANSYVDASGRVVKGTEYLGITTSLYAEVGLWKGLHIQAYFPYTIAENTFGDGARFRNAGGGDAQLALQYSPPFRWPVKTAVRVDFKVPLYDVADIGGPLATQFPAFGDGQLDITFWLSVGYSLPRTPLYFFAELGYRHRTEVHVSDGDARTFGDGIAWFAQVGYTIQKLVLLSVNFGGVVPFQEDPWTKGYATLGPALYIPIYKGLAAEARFDPVVWAHNSAKGYGFGFGLSYKR